MPRTDLAHAALEAVETHHRFGHHCHDGAWWNPNAGTRGPCPVMGHLRVAREQVDRLASAVHDAAHQDPVAWAVGMAAAGYTQADVDYLNDDEREEAHAGFLQMGRHAIEALAEHLDRDPAVEERARALLARLQAHAPAGE